MSSCNYLLPPLGRSLVQLTRSLHANEARTRRSDHSASFSCSFPKAPARVSGWLGGLLPFRHPEHKFLSKHARRNRSGATPRHRHKSTIPRSSRRWSSDLPILEWRWTCFSRAPAAKTAAAGSKPSRTAWPTSSVKPTAGLATSSAIQPNPRCRRTCSPPRSPHFPRLG